jgi:DNA-binding SARP family transcriptional activator
LRPRPVTRGEVTARLWPDTDERHASWRLRAALHRLPSHEGARLVSCRDEELSLLPAIAVDVHTLEEQAMAFLEELEDDAARAVQVEHISALTHDLLPTWDDDWLLLERERHRQLRIHALESLSRSLRRSRRFALAMHCALAAVDAEPLRESAHRRVIEVHLAEGNLAEALRQFHVCRRHLADELAVPPSRSLQELVFGSR